MLTQKNIITIFSLPVAVLLIGIAAKLILFESPSAAADSAALAEQTKKSISIPYISGDPIIGKKNAPITIIAFGDFGCPSCAAAHRVFTEITTSYPTKIKVVWKGLPVTRYPTPSDRAHTYAFCANKQGKFREFSDVLFQNPQALKDSDLAQAAQTAGLADKQLQNCLINTEPAEYIAQVKSIATFLSIQTVPAAYIGDSALPKEVLSSAQALAAYLGIE
jgi:protein-disulfide isomerase